MITTRDQFRGMRWRITQRPAKDASASDPMSGFGFFVFTSDPGPDGKRISMPIMRGQFWSDQNGYIRDDYLRAWGYVPTPPVEDDEDDYCECCGRSW